jgi:hypothetical protein
MLAGSNRETRIDRMRLRTWTLLLLTGAALLVAVPSFAFAGDLETDVANDIPGSPLPAAQPVTGSVASVGANDADDVYAVQLKAGQWFWAELHGAPDTATDFDLFLFGPDAKSVSGQVAALARSERENTSFEWVRFKAPTDMTVYVDVYAFGGTGTYSLRYGKPGTEVSMSVGGPKTVAWGGTATLTGTMKRVADAKPVADQRVVLFHKPAGKSNYSRLAETRTDAAGVYRFAVKPKKQTRYLARFLGSSSYVLPVDPASISVIPRAWLSTPAVPYGLRRNVAFSVAGYLKPHHPSGGRNVKIRCYLRQRNGSYVWKKTVLASSADFRTSSGTLVTRYKARVVLPYTGYWRIRAYIDGDSTHTSAWSVASRYRTVR